MNKVYSIICPMCHCSLMRDHYEKYDKPEFFYVKKCDTCSYSLNMRIADEFESAFEFEEILNDAIDLANTPWEKSFVDGIRVLYELKDIDAHLTEKQLDILTKIASRLR